jgi:rare lipoprotein A
MRPPFYLRAGHLVPALGAFAVTSSFVSTGVLSAHAASPPTATTTASGSQPLDASVRRAHVGYRKPVIVTGRLANGVAGQKLTLVYEPSGGSSWQPVATATSGSGGAYRLSTRLERSGSLRVVADDGATLRSTAAPEIAASATTAGSAATPIYVGAGIVERRGDRNVLRGQRVTVRGRLAPLTVDAPVALQARRGRRWVTVAHARTGRRGRFALTFAPGGTGTVPVRLRFAGNAVNDASTQRAGVVNVYRLAGASWYGPGGGLACGGTLTSSTLGVANKTLPCGTMVTLHYGNHTVRVPVVDRGPYVAGRDYDLTPATKARLGFGDTGTIWATA